MVKEILSKFSAEANRTATRCGLSAMDQAFTDGGTANDALHSAFRAYRTEFANGIIDALSAANLTIEVDWSMGAPPSEPLNHPWLVHRNGWSHAKVAKRSAGAWWIDGNRYSDHLAFDRHRPAPSTPKDAD